VEGSLGARIRAHRRVPYVAVIGAAEAAAGTVSVRLRDGGHHSVDQGEMVARMTR